MTSSSSHHSPRKPIIKPSIEPISSKSDENSSATGPANSPSSSSTTDTYNETRDAFDGYTQYKIKLKRFNLVILCNFILLIIYVYQSFIIYFEAVTNHLFSLTFKN